MKKNLSIKFCFAIIAFVSISSVYGQQNRKQWQLGAGIGFSQYYGDLSNQFIDKDLFNESKSLFVEKYTSKGTGIRVQYSNASLKANDRSNEKNTNFNRALNFKSDIDELNIQFIFYSDNDKIFSQSAIISPFFSIGVGLLYFEPYADLFDAQGRRYYYWSDNSIRSLNENDPLAATAIILEQDGKYETKLNPLLTEQNDEYRNFALTIPIELGIKFRLSNSFNVLLSSSVHYSTTDYFDDVSNKPIKSLYANELSEYAANPSGTISSVRGNNDDWNDLIVNANLSLAFSFGNRKTTLRANPIVVNGEYYQWANQAIKTDTDIVVERDSLFSFERKSIMDSLNAVALDQVFQLNILDTTELFTSGTMDYSDSIVTVSVEAKLAVGSATTVVERIEESRVEDSFLDDKKSTNKIINKKVMVLSADTVQSVLKKKPNITIVDSVQQSQQTKFTELESLVNEENDSYNNPKSEMLQQNVKNLNEINENIYAINQKLDSIGRNISSNNNVRTNNSIDSLRFVVSTLQNKNALHRANTSSNASSENEVKYFMAYDELLKQQQIQIARLNSKISSIQEGQKSDSNNKSGNAASNWSNVEYEKRLITANANLIKVNNELNRIKLKQQTDSSLVQNQSARLLQIESKLNQLEKDSVVPVFRDTVYTYKSVSVSDSTKLLSVINRLQRETNAIKLELDMQKALNKVNEKNSQEVMNTELEKWTQQKTQLTEIEKENKALKLQLQNLENKMIAEELKKGNAESRVSFEREIASYRNQKIFFGFNKSSLDAKYNELLLTYSNLLKKYPRLKIKLVGFADKTGNAQYNLMLSEKRANAVRQALLFNNINPTQIVISFSGDTKSEGGAYTSSYYRRVDVILIEN